MAAAQMEKLFRSVHGTAPENLIEKIVRLRIFDSTFWKEHCFGLTAVLLVDKAMQLTNYGGVYSENNKPTPFLCLVLKMLQLKPEMDIVKMFIEQEDAKYLRVLGAFYLRLVGSPVEIYKNLEPLYADYRKIVYQTRTGWGLTHMDEFIDTLLTDDFCCDISLPHLPPRRILEANGVLEPRECLVKEPMKDEIDEMEYVSSSDDEDTEDNGNKAEVEPKLKVPTNQQANPEQVSLPVAEKARFNAVVEDERVGSSSEPQHGAEKGYSRSGSPRPSEPKSSRFGSTRKRSSDRSAGGTRSRDRSGRTRSRDRSSSKRSRDRSGSKRSRDRSGRTRSRDRSGSKLSRDRSGSKRSRDRSGRTRSRNRSNSSYRNRDEVQTDNTVERNEHSGHKKERHKKEKKSKKKKMIFKGLKQTPGDSKGDTSNASSGAPTENSVEYWNDMREKLGIKPLKK